MKSVLIRWSGNLLLIVISLAVGVLGFEWAVRLTMPQFDTSGHVRFAKDIGSVNVGLPDSSQRQIKNTGDFDVMVTFNEVGLRDPLPPGAAIGDSVLVVGDSFTFGWGIAEGKRFSDLLGQSLGRTSVNIGVPTDFNGYARLLDYAREHGATTRNVVVGVCMENDLDRYDVPRIAETPTPAGTQLNIRGIKHWLTEHSAAYFFLTTIIHGNPALKQAAIRAGLIIENLAGMQRTGYSPELIEASADRLSTLVDGLEAQILIIPARGLWVGTDQQKAEARRVHDDFVAASQARGLTIIDPRPVFEATDPLSYHFRNDGHWNEAGHAVAADLLATSMRN